MQDVLDAISRVDRYTAGGVPEAASTDPVWDAIFYNLAVIGEAIKDVSSETLSREPGIDWSAAARMRDVIIHRYFATDRSIVGATVEDDLPKMKAAVERLLGL